jgi:hypothetical protein
MYAHGQIECWDTVFLVYMLIISLLKGQNTNQLCAKMFLGAK